MPAESGLGEASFYSRRLPLGARRSLALRPAAPPTVSPVTARAWGASRSTVQNFLHPTGATRPVGASCLLDVVAAGGKIIQSQSRHRRLIGRACDRRHRLVTRHLPFPSKRSAGHLSLTSNDTNAASWVARHGGGLDSCVPARGASRYRACSCRRRVRRASTDAAGRRSARPRPVRHACSDRRRRIERGARPLPSRYALDPRRDVLDGLV